MLGHGVSHWHRLFCVYHSRVPDASGEWIFYLSLLLISMTILPSLFLGTVRRQWILVWIGPLPSSPPVVPTGTDWFQDLFSSIATKKGAKRPRRSFLSYSKDSFSSSFFSIGEWESSGKHFLVVFFLLFFFFEGKQDKCQLLLFKLQMSKVLNNSEKEETKDDGLYCWHAKSRAPSSQESEWWICIVLPLPLPLGFVMPQHPKTLRMLEQQKRDQDNDKKENERLSILSPFDNAHAKKRRANPSSSMMTADWEWESMSHKL